MRFLGHVTEPPAKLNGVEPDFAAVEEDLAARRFEQARQDASRGCLTGSVRPEITDNFSGMDGKADVVDDRVSIESFHQASCFEHLVLTEGLCPSDSPTRSLARRFAGSLRSRGSVAALPRACHIQGASAPRTPRRALSRGPQCPAPFARLGRCAPSRMPYSRGVRPSDSPTRSLPPSPRLR